jgi:hypothetical protein
VSIFSLLCIFIIFFSIVQAAFYAEGDALYWQASEEGLAYAQKVEGTSFSTKEPRYEWDFGFKLGLSTRSEWKATLLLTQFNTHTDAWPRVSGEENLFPLWLVPGGFAAEAIKMHWRLHLAFIDALLSKKYTLSRHLFMRPIVGLRYAVARQKFNFLYEGGNFGADPERIGMKNKFWGIGPYAGMGMEYPFSHLFSVYAQGALALVYGQFYVHENARRVKSHVKVATFLDTFCRVVPIAEGSVLLRYQKQWEKKRLCIQAGWDFVLLFDQNHLQPLIGQTAILDKPGNLGLKGLQVGVEFGY